MDEILSKASNQAVSFAIRSGISIASGFAIKTVTKFLDKIPESEKARIKAARTKLLTKISIISTSIDLIRLEAARGNSALEATVDLVNDLKAEIDNFDENMNQVIEDLSKMNEKDSVKYVERAMNSLLDSINDAIPLINLSLITCGVNLTSNLSSHISPSCLLQASDCLLRCNSSFVSHKGMSSVTAGPLFDLKLYTVFYNPSRFKYVNDNSDTATTSSTQSSDEPSGLLAISWKEEFARALCKVVRLKGKNFSHELVIEEDFNDGRYHDDDENPQVKRFKVLDIRRQFFSASGRLLRLDSSTSPVLIFKVQTEQGFEYVALGETGAEFDESSDDSDGSDYEDAAETANVEKHKKLSLLQYLVRLAALQENEQCSILDVKDEKLTLYLRDETDNSVIPKSKEQKKIDASKNETRARTLQLDSSINRLEHLSLKNSTD